MSKLHAFTVDVEDYFQVSAFERHIPRDHWSRYESRVEGNTRALLRLLERHDARGTFFVLGWVADHHPRLVRDIQRAGHEIGSHGYWHRLAYHQTPAEFRADARRTRDALEQLVGTAVTAYRAPSFSITRRSLWALEILAEEGFTVDSSVFPVRHDRYGVPDAPTGPHRRDTPAGSLWEFPPAVLPLGRFNLPVGGGGYFRLYPWLCTRYLLSRVASLGQPFLFYIHPWEIDPRPPRLQVGSRPARLRHSLNLTSTPDKLERLLRTFRFGRLRDVLNDLSPQARSASEEEPPQASPSLARQASEEPAASYGQPRN
jgi:polysaccharide deacetylase family protein (PEP-CTERM system associated)